MTESSREALLAAVRRMWSEKDPVPVGLVARMQSVAASESDVDLDYELLVLAERSRELAGARGTTSYTLQFTCGDLSVLIRAAAEEEPVGGGRLDGWLAPASTMSVRVMSIGGDREWETATDARGRFEFRRLPAGLFRLWLTPHDGSRPFGTPAFEL